MQRLNKFLFTLTLITLFIATVTLVGFFFMLMQSQPLVKQNNFLNASSAHQSQILVKRIFQLTTKPQTPDKPLVLSFSEEELKGLSGLVHRAIPKLSSQVELQTQVLMLSFTFDTGIPIARRFINIHLKVLPSVGSLALTDIKIGSFAIKKDWLLQLIAWGINSQVKPELGNKLIHAIQSVHFSYEAVVLGIDLPTELTTKDEDKYLLFKEIRDKLALLGDVDKIRSYYHDIFKFSRQLSINNSLSRYVAFIFKQAKKNTIRLDDTTAVIENRAALTALTLFFGPERFMLLVGDMAPISASEKSRRRLLQGTTTLHNRVDLQKHYIYSIVLQLLGDQKISDAIGEMKEFLDSHKGGTGFSFADLLADRAGTRLAFSATSSEEKALYMQNIVTELLNEADMIPAIKNLPENISQTEFETVYGDINSAVYKTLLNEMDNRLYQLDLYK